MILILHLLGEGQFYLNFNNAERPFYEMSAIAIENFSRICSVNSKHNRLTKTF